MQIAVLVPLRYPTEKAYGINIAYTTEALENLGNSVTIYTVGKSFTDFRGNKVIGMENLLLRVANLMRKSNYAAINVPGFYLFQFGFGFTVIRKISRPSIPEIVITRSPIVAFISSHLLSQHIRIVLELHHMPSQLEKKLINYSTKSVFLVVTNCEFGSHLTNKGITKSYEVIPNAAPNTFHDLCTINRKYSLPMLIGYAGKSMSSGHDNGLTICLELLENCPELGAKIRFILIGTEETFHSKVNTAIKQGLISDTSITLINHLSHEELLLEIANFDLALIPYPEEPYYERSFPMKIVEMASAGIPMIISNTKAHRRILGEANEFFFIPGSYMSLQKCIENILENIELISPERNRVISLAKNFTYEKRASALLKVAGK